MCTLSWISEADGYQLFFNRDEQRTRLTASPAARKNWDGCEVIAPVDTNAGGTWISTNEHGVSLCLLNNYGASDVLLKRTDQAALRSRGLLVKELSSMNSKAAFQQQIQSLDLSRYNAFDLLCFAPGCSPLLLRWDGEVRELIENPAMPMTSSSFDTEAVIDGRIRQFHDLVNETAINRRLLQQYHSAHTPEKGAYSVCMHRSDACTVSFSHIKVTASEIHFHYQDGSPCEANPAIQVSMNKTNAGLAFELEASA